MMSPETAMRQAHLTADEYMKACQDHIDRLFGKGYAQANPALLGAMVIASALDFHSAMVGEIIEKPVARRP